MNGFMKFLVGLGLFGLLAFVCINNHKHQFSLPELSIVQAKLKASGFPKVKSSLDGDTVTLKGAVPSAEAKAKAEQDVLALDGIDAVVNQLTINDGPGYFSARFVKKVDGVVLKGVLPSEAVKQGILTEATSLWGEGKVTDELTIEAGEVSPKLLDSLKGYLPRVKDLQGGKLVATNQDFNLYGRSSDPDLSGKLLTEYQPNLPKGTKLGIHVGQPWTRDNLMGIARVSGENVVLSGVVPDWDTHDQILELANKEYGENKVVNHMNVADLAAEAKIVDGFGTLFPALKGVDGGQLTVTADKATFGAYLDPESEEGKNLKEKLSGQWPDLDFDLATKFATSECQDAVNAILSSGKIEFEYDSDQIKAESAPLLRQIASALRRCPDSTVEVQGHTDADGDDTYNLELSQRRADSVRMRLLALGMPEDRASTKGYGETEPIATNDTDEGKQENRRIEFELKGSEN